MQTYESNNCNFWLLKQFKRDLEATKRKNDYLSFNMTAQISRHVQAMNPKDIIILPEENKTVSIFEIQETPIPLQNIQDNIASNDNSYVIKVTLLKEHIDVSEFQEDSFESIIKANLHLINLNKYADIIQRVVNDSSVSTSSAMLLKTLMETDDISGFISKNKHIFYQYDPICYINKLAMKKGLKKSLIGKLSEQGDYVYKIFQGSKQPSRDVLISISIGMEMELSEVQTLLRLSKTATLDPKEKRDSIIIFGIINRMTITEVNNLLYDNKETTLT